MVTGENLKFENDRSGSHFFLFFFLLTDRIYIYTYLFVIVLKWIESDIF